MSNRDEQLAAIRRLAKDRNTSDAEMIDALEARTNSMVAAHAATALYAARTMATLTAGLVALLPDGLEDVLVDTMSKSLEQVIKSVMALSVRSMSDEQYEAVPDSDMLPRIRQAKDGADTVTSALNQLLRDLLRAQKISQGDGS